MFGIGGFELFLILIFGFLIFGPDKLPEIAKTVGKAIARFRGAQEEMATTLNAQSFIDKDSDEPLKNPLEVIEKAANEAQTKTEAAQASVAVATDKAAEKLQEKSASFAERKAAYDRARAERKAAEQAAAREAEHQATEARENPRTKVKPKVAISTEEATDDADVEKNAKAGDA